MNTVIIVLIVVVIFLITQKMQKKEDFNPFDGNSWKGLGKTIESGINQGVSTIADPNTWKSIGNTIESGFNQGVSAIGNISNNISNNKQGNNQIINCGDATMELCNDPIYQFSCPNECAKGTNSIAQCRQWAFRDSNECKANPNYMESQCAQACNERKIKYNT